MIYDFQKKARASIFLAKFLTRSWGDRHETSLHENFQLLATAAFAAAALAYAGQAQATPGFIALEGSDATAFHQDPSYSPQMFHYSSDGQSALPVLIHNPAGTVTIDHPNAASVFYTNTLSGLGLTTANHSAIYIESPGGCCQADNTALISLIGAATDTSPNSGGFGSTYADGTQNGSGLPALWRELGDARAGAGEPNIPG